MQDLVLLRAATPWHEAVAIVLEVIARRPRRDAFPTPVAIILTPAGDVRVSPNRGMTSQPVSAAVALLHDLIGAANTPSALQQVIQENIGVGARCGTLDELAAALGYFERPGRKRDIAEAYARAHALHDKTMRETELNRLRTKALRGQGGTAPPPLARTALIAFGCLALLAASIELISMAVAKRPVAEPVAAAPPAMTATATGTTGVLDTPAASLPARRDSEPAESTPATLGAATTPVTPNAPRTSAVSSRATTSASPAPPAPRAAVPPTRRLPESVVTTLPEATASAAARRPTLPTDPVDLPATEWVISIRDVTASVPAGPDDDIESRRRDTTPLQLFTADDRDVEPPTLLRPQLPSRLISPTTLPHASTLEFIIGENGRVERLHLESVNNRLSEKMLLAAAKAWVFQPATRDGWPVRYRLRVQLVE